MTLSTYHNSGVLLKLYKSETTKVQVSKYKKKEWYKVCIVQQSDPTSSTKEEGVQTTNHAPLLRCPAGVPRTTTKASGTSAAPLIWQCICVRKSKHKKSNQ